jgi:hypothetical protein
MEREAVPRELRPFVDGEGRLVQWPARQKVQRQAIGYLASQFTAGTEYHERDVNDLLCRWHTFGDWALLRRLLFNWGHMDREPDGTRYRLRARSLNSPMTPTS